MMVNVTVRNVAEEVHVKLKRRAARNGNSVEAECMAILVETLDSENDTLPIRYEIAGRLRHVLEQVNSVRPYGNRLRAAELALMLGHNDGGAVDAWITGNRDQPFGELAKIADLFSINADWLIHGYGRPYKIERFESFQSGQKAFEALMERRADSMALVRADRQSDGKRDGGGSLAIVLTYGAFRSVVLDTPVALVVHDKMSDGMEDRLVRFVTMLRAFSRLSGMGRPCPTITSYDVGFEDYLSLIHGQVYPLEFLRNQRQTVWWEDIWDWDHMTRQGDRASPDAPDRYWRGFNRVRDWVRRHSENESSSDYLGWVEDRKWADNFDVWQWSTEFRRRVDPQSLAGR